MSEEWGAFPKPWRLEPGDRGIPYSVDEAKLVVITHMDLDDYHRQLMGWLCDRVDVLEEKALHADEEDRRNLSENRLSDSPT